MGLHFSTWIKLPLPLESKHANKKSATCHTTFFSWLKWHSVIASDDNDDDVLDDGGDSDNDNFDEDDIAIVIDLSTSFWAYVFFKIWFSEPSWAC